MKTTRSETGNVSFYYQDYPYQDCSWWCLRTVFTAENRIKCAQITYEEETGKHVWTCYTECEP
ncbi:hypothetical protein MKX03_010483 [Papaver bracteatum]|nr:hypothetical protein MKX03_010483 [Papaver bracteatum]